MVAELFFLAGITSGRCGFVAETRIEPQFPQLETHALSAGFDASTINVPQTCEHMLILAQASPVTADVDLKRGSRANPWNTKHRVS